MMMQEMLEKVRLALDEDLGSRGDLTSQALFTREDRGEGFFVMRESGRVAGLPVASCVFQLLDRQVDFRPLVYEGEDVEGGTRLIRVSGPLLSILEGERTALNFLQRLSGIATLTAAFVRLAAPYGVEIRDTRKTTPGLRALEKYAVGVGGGVNHRMGLYDAVLIKDNHIRAVGGVEMALRLVRQEYGNAFPVEVEVQDLEQLKEALEAGAETIMLDNMDTDAMKEAVRITAGQARLEASGGITLERVEEVASTGVDFISVGALTHSFRSLDIALDLE
jgi:nicotinate-nucleotide pyrophosphorylase (carboxylating)